MGHESDNTVLTMLMAVKQESLKPFPGFHVYRVFPVYTVMLSIARVPKEATNVLPASKL